MITRDEIAQIIHDKQCGCELGGDEAPAHLLPPIAFSTYSAPADALLELLSKRLPAGTLPAYQLDDFGRDVVRRARSAILNHGGRAYPVWSTNEKLAVAVVLNDQATLDEMDFTWGEAITSVCGGVWQPPKDFDAWRDAIRAELGLGDQP